MMEISDILIPFFAIGLAELGDKTQLSVLLISTKTKDHFALLLGVMAAFLLVDGLAILAGSWITDVVPEHILKVASGILFIFFGVLILKDLKKDDDEDVQDDDSVKNPAISGFLLISLTEWGDKTQLASALFATQYDPLMVLIGAMAALTLLSLMAIYLGKIILKRIDKKIITKLASAAFIVLGIYLLIL